MKNIILFGVPRSGKTTFARMILKEFSGYNIIEEDIVYTAYKQAVMNLEKKRNTNKNVVVNVETDSLLPYELAKQFFDKNIMYEPKLNFILESSNIDTKTLMEYSKDNIVLVFGYPKLTVKECINNVHIHDTGADWTYVEPDWRLNKFFTVYLKESKQLVKDCKKLNLKFVDTSYNRKEVLNNLFEWLKEENSNSKKISKITC